MARSKLWNASLQVSQQLLWRNCATTSTPIDISRSLHGVLSPTVLSAIHYPHNHCFIHRLPPEIIGEIFGHYVFDDNPRVLRPSSRVSAHQNARTSALTLCHVCSSWRALAVSTSSLWSSLCVVWPKENYAHLVRLWLERSGSRLLSLSLHQGPFTRDDAFVMNEILALCITHARRWRDVTLAVNDTVQDIFGDLEMGTAISLQSFDLGIVHWSKPQMDQLLSTLYSSPCLRRVTWVRSCVYELPATLSWERLTHIKMDCIATSGELVNILSECKEMEVLDVGLVESNSPHSLPAISLQSLRTLRLGGGDDLALLFDALTLPSLTALEMPLGFGCPALQGWKAVFALIHRSCCSLKRIVYGGYCINEDELIDAMISPSFSSLNDLTLNLSITDKMLHALTLRVDGFSPLPNMERIVLKDCRTSDGMLSNLVYSRLSTSQSPRPNLRFVQARLRGPGPYFQDSQLAQALKHTCIDIVIKDRDPAPYGTKY